MHKILRAASWIAPLFVLVSVTLAHAQSMNDYCAAPHKIVWPANHPVWSLCWVSPDSSSGVDGSGIELRDVFYKGKLVLRRAGIPVLNVEYDPGGCGSLRDWQNGLADFESDGFVPPPGSRYAEPTKPPRTMCDHPGTDKGDFSGVAAQRCPANWCSPPNCRPDHTVIRKNGPFDWMDPSTLASVLPRASSPATSNLTITTPTGAWNSISVVTARTASKRPARSPMRTR